MDLTRAFASARGHDWYCTGKTCRNGHVACRSVVNSNCHECMSDKRRANPVWAQRGALKRLARLAVDSDYAEYRRAQKTAAERNRRKRLDVRASRAAERRSRQAAKIKRTPTWTDQVAIRAMYRQAASITQITGIPHHVDHIIPLCGQTVSGLHVSANLQILPKTENLKKGAKFDV